MGFFDNPDMSEIAQSHLNQIVKLEETEAKALIQRYREIRQELRDRLDSVPGDTFTAQQLRGVLIQVESAIEAMQRGLLDGMTESSRKAALRGSENLIRETEQFNSIFSGAAANINVNAAVVALDTSNFLVSRYETSLQSYSASVRSLISRELSEAVITQAPTGNVIKSLGSFLTGEEWKLRQLARTELHHVYNTAKQNTLFQAALSLPDLKKTLIHPMDNRTGDDSKKAAADNLIEDVDKPFKYSFTRRLNNGEVKTINRVFMVPPDRPNDRSIMVPYRTEWDSDA